MDPFLAEIRIFPYTFAPEGWAWCNGQTLPLAQNSALFALLGVAYGGDGKTSFAIPNLQGSVPIGSGTAPGISERTRGESGGSQTVTITISEMPAHQHIVRASSAPATSASPHSNVIAHASADAYVPNPSHFSRFDVQSLEYAGGGAPHNNMQPFLAINYCIALQGVFPPRG